MDWCDVQEVLVDDSDNHNCLFVRSLIFTSILKMIKYGVYKRQNQAYSQPNINDSKNFSEIGLR